MAGLKAIRDLGEHIASDFSADPAKESTQGGYQDHVADYLPDLYAIAPISKLLQRIRGLFVCRHHSYGPPPVPVAGAPASGASRVLRRICSIWASYEGTCGAGFAHPPTSKPDGFATGAS
jgi:hypothetical protein